MGYFAVTNRLLPARFTVSACHLSFWVLTGPWYELFCKKYFLDIGLRIFPDEDLRRFRLAVPFDTQDGDLTDLSNVVLDPEISPLIFGRPVEIDRDRIKYDGSSLGQAGIGDRVIAVSQRESRSEPETAKDINFSTWTIELKDVARAREPAYVRFRFPVRKPTRIWSSKGWGFAKRGIIADFRIADVRESIILGQGRAEADHIQPIERLFLFVVAPAHFVPKHVSPNLHYSRLLEPKVWEKYLTSCGPYDAGTKFSIHQWRSYQSDKPTPISAANPFRAYADFTREFGREILVYYFAGALGTPLLLKVGDVMWNAIKNTIWQ
jgi:hypothetical protein